MRISCLTTLVVDLISVFVTRARALRRTSFLLFGLCVFLLACSERELVRPHVKIAGQTMGTQYHVTVIGAADADALKTSLDTRLVQINKIMSTYDPESELMQVNAAPVSQALPVSGELAEVVALSLQIHQQTAGGFDVTVGPLVNRWGFGPVEAQGKPSDAEIAALLETVGSDALALQRTDAGWLLSKNRPVFIDLSAIAKGWAVDQLAELLLARGYSDFLVEIGGELRVAGTNPRSKPWAIAVERPSLAQGGVQEAIALSNLSVATSGSYRNYQMYNGVQYSHTINPESGLPVTHNMVSITVLAETCAEADALATGFNVLGPTAALTMAEERNLAVFILVDDDGKIRELASSRFLPYLTQD